jgi:adducin
MKDKMAEVEEQPAAAANGNGTHAESDGEDEAAMRPVDIEQDMREMDRRKRVEAIMSSKLFREELERVVSDSIKDSGGDGVTNLLANMMNVKQSSAGGATAISGAGISLGSVIPINDIRGLEGMSYRKDEKLLRCKLAAIYRLVDMYGWTQSIYNHISVRISQDTEHFLINPFGMLYNEITASGLVKVDMQGEVVEAGTTNFGVNVAGFMLHAAIHSARPDLKCVIHVHTPNIIAVSSMKCGLLYLSQESCLIGDVSYHSYEGLVVEKAEWETLSRDLGVHNKVMLLRNHGAVCCGETIEEAFYYAYHLVLACDTQLKMVPLGIDNLIMIDEPTRRKVYEMGQLGGGGVDSLNQDGPVGGAGDKKKNKKWGVGEMEFEAMMRMMDNAGYRSGYVYKQPLVKEEPPKPKSDVELPAAVSSLGFLLEEQNLYKDGPLQALLGGFNKSYKEAGRTKWMNSPNVYQKVEVLETGTPDPKKITKWVQDGSPSKSTPIKIDSPNTFVPLGTSKKEFRRIQSAMKEGRRAGGITAGPESKVLDGATWDEAQAMQDGKTVDHVDYKVGAASKGIIQRDFQHHATVFKSAYARNPFDNVSEDELAEYRRIIDAKNNPGEITEEEESMGGGPNSTFEGDHTFNGEETDGNRTFSEGEGDTSKATDTEMASPRKEKKKKSGLRTPSFLKKKKKDKKKEK